ncbi:MAG TPA: isochorismatase family protein [Chloroflexia bacterium]|nr:isochorismatase family protein [Chloroflexia bacterium]
MTTTIDAERTETSVPDLAAGSKLFLQWLDGWLDALPTLRLVAFMRENDIKSENVAIISADLIVGFCYKGNLASPRIAGVVEPSVQVFSLAHDMGVTNFALLQEYHTHDAVEFEQFGPHGIRGTEEAEMVESLASLPFSHLFDVIRKNSLHPALHTDMDRWLQLRPEVNTFITVGDCTDLCLYQLAMHLKLGANAIDRRIHVIVPANCVQTYDLPLETAQKIGAMPHDGDLMHAVFLYQLALNGMLVVKGIQ